MAGLTVATWFWGDKYSTEYVAKLASGVRRHLKQPYRFIVVADRDIEIDGVLTYEIPQQDRYLLKEKGCFVRLRAFDPVWQRLTQIHDRVVAIDLDAIVTGPLDSIVDRKEDFVILQGANASNPCPYNGSIWMLRPGYRPDVWSDFSLDAARRVPHDSFPDDQAWMAHKMSQAAGWKAGAASGVYAFKKPGWPAGDGLPSDASVVVFPGHRDPSHFTHLRWVGENWAA